LRAHAVRASIDVLSVKVSFTDIFLLGDVYRAYSTTPLLSSWLGRTAVCIDGGGYFNVDEGKVVSRRLFTVDGTRTREGEHSLVTLEIYGK
jgi:hypothetical protein